MSQIDKPFYLWADHKISLEFDKDFDEFYEQKAQIELRESPEVVKESLESLRKLLEGEGDLEIPKDDVTLTRFLRNCKWYAKSAFEKIKLYYEVQANYPQFFSNLIPDSTEKVLRGAKSRILPYRNADGERILLLESGAKWDPSHVNFGEAIRGISLLINTLTLEPKTQIAGLHVIFDFLDMPLSHVTAITPTQVYAAIRYCQNAMPARYKGIHFVRHPVAFNLLWALVKPFILSKYRGRIHFHGTDFESLHKHVHPSVLPEEFGGELDMPLSDTKEAYDYFKLHDQRFIDAAKHGYVWRKES